MKINKQTKVHYFLVNGTVLIKDVENIPDATGVPSNVILYSTSRNVGMRSLTIMREALEKRISDAVGEGSFLGSIESISYLGHMSQEEFIAGTEVEEEEEIKPVPPVMDMNEITKMAEQFQETLTKLQESIKPLEK